MALKEGARPLRGLRPATPFLWPASGPPALRLLDFAWHQVWNCGALMPVAKSHVTPAAKASGATREVARHVSSFLKKERAGCRSARA